MSFNAYINRDGWNIYRRSYNIRFRVNFHIHGIITIKKKSRIDARYNSSNIASNYDAETCLSSGSFIIGFEVFSFETLTKYAPMPSPILPLTPAI